LVKDGIRVFKLRNTSNMMMCIVEVFVTTISKALVPDKAFGMNIELVQVVIIDSIVLEKCRDFSISTIMECWYIGTRWMSRENKWACVRNKVHQRE
jgi:hypothetical protein